MADKLILFSTSDAERIAKAVKSVEGTLRNVPQLPKRDPSISGGNGFWAKVSDPDYTEATYAWVKQIPQDDGTFEDDEDVSGENDDKPAREQSGYKFVPDDTIVWLRPRFDYYSFEFAFKIIRGKTDATLAKGDTGTISVWDSAGVDTGENISALNLYQDLEATKNVHAILYGETWHLIAGEC